MAKSKTSTKTTTSRTRTKSTSTKTGTAKRTSARSRSAEVAAKQAVGRDQTAQRAYEIWQKRGQPMGQDREHWFQAERELRRTERG